MDPDYRIENWYKIKPQPNRSIKFWMITSSNPNGRGSFKKHQVYSDAVREAERLSMENPQFDFFIMESVEMFQKAPEILRTKL